MFGLALRIRGSKDPRKDSDYFFSHEDMKAFRSRGAIFWVTACFLHASIFSFIFNRFSAAAFSAARNLAPGSTEGPIVKFWFCAIAASGHAAKALPRSIIKSRRLMQPPRLSYEHHTNANYRSGRGRVFWQGGIERQTDVRFGSKAEVKAFYINVRFTPMSVGLS